MHIWKTIINFGTWNNGNHEKTIKWLAGNATTEHWHPRTMRDHKDRFKWNVLHDDKISHSRRQNSSRGGALTIETKTSNPAEGYCISKCLKLNYTVNSKILTSYAACVQQEIERKSQIQSGLNVTVEMEPEKNIFMKS